MTTSCQLWTRTGEPNAEKYIRWGFVCQSDLKGYKVNLFLGFRQGELLDAFL